jgi:hypothetical protein
MGTIHSGITGRADDRDLEPLVVTPRQARILLGVGNTRLYQLIGNGDLESYLDGRVRRITMHSIRRRVARLLAGTGATEATPQPQPRRRGRPHKVQANEAAS